MQERVRAALADPEQDALADVVDVDRHGLTDDPMSWWRLGRTIADRLDHAGVAQVTGFLRRDAVAEIAAELDRALPFVPITHDRRTVYARTSQPGSIDHPALATRSDWICGHVTRDMIPPQSPAHRLYVSPAFKRLVAGCVGADRLFEYADPLAGLVATVLPPGGCYGWHYDTNEYVVTVTIRAAERGGAFEFCPDLRRPGDENLDGLLRATSGSDRRPVRSVRSSPGDLQVFRGRYSLHRVSPVSGGDVRLSLVLSYAERPGVIGPVDRTRAVYGRVTEAHLVAGSAARGADGLIL